MEEFNPLSVMAMLEDPKRSAVVAVAAKEQSAWELLRTAVQDIVRMPEADWEKGAACFTELFLSRGAFFLQQGQVCRKAVFIHQGLLRTFYVHEDGSETTSCFCTEGHFSTSFRSYLLQVPSQIAIQALEDSRLLLITYDELQGLYQQSPYWQQLGRLLTEKEYLVMEQYASVLNRETAKEKYLRLLTEQPQVIQRAPVRHIASYLGVSWETLSRIRRQIEK